jgi:hypothetical protein
MPNWCGNLLTISHEDPKMIVRAKEAFAEGRLLNEFIPVPAGLKEPQVPIETMPKNSEHNAVMRIGTTGVLTNGAPSGTWVTARYPNLGRS